jgi:hypothetical protein
MSTMTEFDPAAVALYETLAAVVHATPGGEPAGAAVAAVLCTVRPDILTDILGWAQCEQTDMARFIYAIAHEVDCDATASQPTINPGIGWRAGDCDGTDPRLVHFGH